MFAGELSQRRRVRHRRENSRRNMKFKIVGAALAAATVLSPVTSASASAPVIESVSVAAGSTVQGGAADCWNIYVSGRRGYGSCYASGEMRSRVVAKCNRYDWWSRRSAWVYQGSSKAITNACWGGKAYRAKGSYIHL